LKIPIEALFGGYFGHIPPNYVTHRPNPQGTVLGLNHVIRDIKHEYRPRSWSWALEEEKRTVQYRKIVTKGLYFTYLGRSPQWSDLHKIM